MNASHMNLVSTAKNGSNVKNRAEQAGLIELVEAYPE
jgi:hypothetical protein